MQQSTAEGVRWPWVLWKWCNVWQPFLFCCSCTTNKHKHIRHICTHDTTLARVCFHNGSGLPDLKCLYLSCKANSKSNSGGKCAASPWQPVMWLRFPRGCGSACNESRKREGRSFAKMIPCLEGNARRWGDWFLLMLRCLLRKRNRWWRSSTSSKSSPSQPLLSQSRESFGAYCTCLMVVDTTSYFSFFTNELRIELNAWLANRFSSAVVKFIGILGARTFNMKCLQCRRQNELHTAWNILISLRDKSWFTLSWACMASFLWLLITLKAF